MTKHRIYSVSVASVYPHYVAKAEKKGRTQAEVDEIIGWLTGYSQERLGDELANDTSFEDFFAHAPRMNPSRCLIKGVVCGVRVEDIEEPTMREIRYLDKLIDELAKGKVGENFAKWAGGLLKSGVQTCRPARAALSDARPSSTGDSAVDGKLPAPSRTGRNGCPDARQSMSRIL